MADVKVTLKRVIDTQGNTDNIHPTTDWDQVENKPATFTPTAHTLNSHTDVDANPTADGQVLTWDAENSQWIASTTAGGGVSKSDLQNVYIYGKADGAITIGQAVQFAGVEGDHILMKAAVPSEINAEPTLMIGIAETTLADNDFGYVIVNGRLNLDTSTYTAGDLLYFNSAVADTTTGALTTTEPTDPYASIQIAAVSIDGVGTGEFIIRNTILTRQINEVIGLQGALDSKVNKSGDTMTGPLSVESNGQGVSFKSILRQPGDDFANYGFYNGDDDSFQGSFGRASSGLRILKPDGNAEITILDAGNVGIGTTSPGKKLEVNGTTYANLTGGGDSFLANNTANYTVLKSDFNGARSWQIDNVGGKVQWYMDGSANEYLFNMTTDGKVGIGTASPGQKLHVVGDTRIEGDLTVNGTMTVVDTDVNTTEQWIITNDGTGPAAIINQTGAQPVIDIQDDGVSAFYIEDGGNVGIGTTDPGYKLEVNGSISMSGSSQLRGKLSDGTNVPLIGIGGDNTIAIGSGVADTLENIKFFPGGSEAMRIKSDGNVGIGTTSPSSKLSVNQAGTGVSDGLWLYSGATPSNGGIALFKSGSKLGSIQSLGADSSISFITNDAGTNYERMRINDVGNVGIGTTDPSSKLEIAVNETSGYNVYSSVINSGNVADGATRFRLEDANGGLNIQKYGTASPGELANASSIYAFDSDLLVGSTDNIKFISNDAYTSTPSMYITSGKVGIGTTSPNQKLEVEGTTRIKRVGQNQLADLYYTGGEFFINANNANNANYRGNVRFTASSSTDTIDTLHINGTNGRVGIGTTSARQKLDVIGNIQISNGLTLRDNSIEQHLTNGNANVAVNYYGYANGHTQFRDFDIYNGKGGLIARFDGSSGNVDVRGNILLTGSTTTTNQGRLIDFTGFDKEGTTDFSDRAYIQHTTNTGGHAGSVLVISSQNDSNDGIAFLTNASSKLKWNSQNLATESFVTSQGYITSADGGNATTLDNIDSGSFLRSDADDTMTANLTLNGYFKRGAYYRKVITLNYPGANVGQGRWFVRLWQTSSGSTFSGGKIRTGGTWSYTAIMGHIEIDYGVYVAANSTSVSGGTRFSSGVGSAYDNMRIGDIEVVDGYVGFYVWSANSNAPYVEFDIYCTREPLFTYVNWTANTMPGQRAVEFHKGISLSGQLDMNNNDIVGVDQIIHDGDTNTYMQFHAADQWRVVTGGAERLEVNNSQTTINQPLQVNSAATINSDAGSRVLYLKQNAAGAGNIVQFVGASNENTWELVGRDTNFYIYNNDLSKRAIYIEDSNNRIGINDNTAPATELDVNGSIRASSNMYLGSVIYHDGDTNTYMQFHAADQWRVVTGGAERLEVNNSQTTINQPLQVNSNLTAGGTITVDTNTVNAMRLYTEQGTGRIADTFADNSTFKSYIYFDPGTSSNDPGYIMHETSDSETNEGVLHLVPSDDNSYGDYVSIHGTNDPDVLRLHTDGTIEGVNNLSASGTITAGGNKLAWVKTQGTTLQSGVNFTLSSGVLYISTTA